LKYKQRRFYSSHHQCCCVGLQTTTECIGPRSNVFFHNAHQVNSCLLSCSIPNAIPEKCALTALLTTDIKSISWLKLAIFLTIAQKPSMIYSVILTVKWVLNSKITENLKQPRNKGY